MFNKVLSLDKTEQFKYRTCTIRRVSSTYGKFLKTVQFTLQNLTIMEKPTFFFFLHLATENTILSEYIYKKK
jgi:hypothetical protein